VKRPAKDPIREERIHEEAIVDAYGSEEKATSWYYYLEGKLSFPFQAFLHARFGVGADVLKPYKETIERWLWPDVLRNQDTSVAKAKQAISSYRKAVGEPGGLAELMVFYCEQAAGYCSDIGYQDDGYFDALVRMFEQALTITDQLPASDCGALIARLDRVRLVSHNFGYGVGDNMDSMLAKYART
jgi:hypothetical protein